MKSKIARYGGLALILSSLLLLGSPTAGYEATVVRVIDGDTILLSNGEKVRYIGINTPEVHHPTRGKEPYGEVAAEANRRLVEGKTVRLEFDVRQRDKYGRLLAYVYVDGQMVNRTLVRDGYAEVATYPPNVRHQDEFLKLQREAREQSRGLWASTSSSMSNSPSSSLNNSAGDEVKVRGYYRKDGTHVRPHTRSAPKR